MRYFSRDFKLIRLRMIASAAATPTRRSRMLQTLSGTAMEGLEPCGTISQAYATPLGGSDDVIADSPCFRTSRDGNLQTAAVQ